MKKNQGIEVVGIGIFLWIVGIGRLSLGGEISDHFPSPTLLYLEVADIEKTGKLFEQTALGRILAEPEVGSFLESATTKFRATLAFFDALSAMKLEDLRALVSNGAALGFILRMEKGTPDPALLLACRCPNEVASRFLIRLPSLLEKIDPSLAKVPLSLDRVNMLPFQEMRIVLAYREGVFLMEFASKDGTSSILSPLQPLSKTEPFPIIQKRLGPHHVSLFVNTQILFSLLATIPNPQTKDLLDLLGAGGVTGIHGVGYAITAEPPGFATRFFLAAPAPRTGIFECIGTGGISKEILDAIPAEAEFFHASSFLPAKFLPFLRSLLAATGKDGETLAPFLVKAQEALGLPLEKFLQSLDGAMAVMVVDPSTVGGISFLGLNGLAKVVKVGDPDLVANALLSLIQFAVKHRADLPIGCGSFSMRHQGVTLHGLNLGSLLVPCFAIQGKTLILGTNPQVVTRILDTLAGRTPSLSSLPSFLEATQRFGTEISSLTYNLGPKMSGFGSDFSSLSFLAGLLLPAFQHAKDSAKKTPCTHHLEQIRQGIEAFIQTKGERPPRLESLYAEGEGILPDLTILRCPENGIGFYYIAHLPLELAPETPLVFDPAGAHRKGRHILFADGSCRFLSEEELHSLLAQLEDAYPDAEILDPWPAEPASVENLDQGKNPLDAIASLFEQTSPSTRRFLLDLFPLYKLPPTATINRHFFPAASACRFDAEGVYGESFGPLPFGNVRFDNIATYLGGGGGTSLLLFAAIAIPNLLESRIQINEDHTIAVLQAYAAAQETFRKANYSAQIDPAKIQGYCEDFPQLYYLTVDDPPHPLALIPKAMADATSSENGYRGYYFVSGKTDATHFALWAVPVRYGQSGIHTYYIDQEGQVRGKDLGGKTFPAGEWPMPDESWFSLEERMNGDK